MFCTVTGTLTVGVTTGCDWLEAVPEGGVSANTATIIIIKKVVSTIVNARCFFVAYAILLSFGIYFSSIYLMRSLHIIYSHNYMHKSGLMYTY